MIIGIVSTANHRRRFYEVLLSSHTLLYFTPDEILRGIAAYCDGFLLDTGLLNGERRKLQKLLSRMPGTEVSGVMAGEESHPCVVQHDSAGGVKFQCGRMAAAMEREREQEMEREAESACTGSSGRMHMLVFQDVSE